MVQLFESYGRGARVKYLISVITDLLAKSISFAK